MTDRPGLGHEEVEAHLRHFYRAAAASQECEGLWLLAQTEAGCATEETLRQAREHLDTCSHCAEVAELSAALAGPVRLSGERPATRERRAVARARRWIVPGAASLAVAAAWMMAVIPRGEKPMESTLVAKGGSDVPSLETGVSVEGPSVEGSSVDGFSVALERRGVVRLLQGGEVLVAGDVLGFFTTSPRGGYVGVFAVDGAGRVTTLYPADGTAVMQPFGPGEKQPLPDGATVDAGGTCHAIVAVVADAPMALDGVAQQLRLALPPSPPACAFAPALNGVRAVRVVETRM